MRKSLQSLACAKINLFLRVAGRRSDGYHELDSVFVPVSLYDRLAIDILVDQPASITLKCDNAAIGSGEENLAFRAVRDFLKEFAIKAAVAIDLRKEIPAGAGLGGGSSDAGTVLRMMSSLCDVNDQARLAALALKLGADVPFFLSPVTSHVRGIGEKVEPLEPIPRVELLLAVPRIHVPTVEVYRNLKPEHWSGPASADDIRGIGQGKFDQNVLINDLEKVACEKWPEIAELKQFIYEAGATAAAMTGSGSAVFGVFASQQEVVRATEEVQRRAPGTQMFAVASIA